MTLKENRYSLIMLVDDSDVDNLINKYFLEQENVTKKVIVFKDAHGALEYLTLLKDKSNSLTDKPDLIMLDINMPSMNGFQFLDEFTKLPSSTKDSINIVMLTSSLKQEDVERSKKYSCVKNFISKPLTNQELQDI